MMRQVWIQALLLLYQRKGFLRKPWKVWTTMETSNPLIHSLFLFLFASEMRRWCNPDATPWLCGICVGLKDLSRAMFSGLSAAAIYEVRIMGVYTCLCVCEWHIKSQWAGIVVRWALHYRCSFGFLRFQATFSSTWKAKLWHWLVYLNYGK